MAAPADPVLGRGRSIRAKARTASRRQLYVRDFAGIRQADIPTKGEGLGYIVAVVGTVIAVGARWGLLQALGDLPLYITFNPVVFVTAIIGGTRPGILATILCALATYLFFIEPVPGRLLPTIVAMAFFVLVNIGVSLLGGKLRSQSEVLRQREEWFRTMADAIPQLTWTARPDGSIFWFNRRLLEYTGATQEQLEGWGWKSVHHPEALPRVLERLDHSLATGEPFEMEQALRGADGRFRAFLTRALPLKDSDGKVVFWFGTCTDITELREGERALRRQAHMIDLSPTATLVRRPDGTITFWSDGAERLYGWTRAEALGRNAGDLLRTEASEPIENIIAKLQTGGIWKGELRQYTRDGRRVIVESHWLAELNDKAKLEEVLESNIEITERKRLQEHLQEEVDARTAEVREAMADLEHMSYSMIHDMRAPLRAMESFAYILKAECPDCQHPPGSDYLESIRGSAIRLDSFITGALNYNQLLRQNVRLTSVNVRELLRGIIDTYPNLHPRVADVIVDIRDVSVVGNESLLTQIFGNLLDNAVKFTSLGTRPCVHVWAEEVRAAGTGEDHGPAIRIWIEDNGIGIPEELQEKIFGMFQRMHSPRQYPGTGVGLTIVKKAVERMNGQVGLQSEPGKGSKFWIELPNARRREPVNEPVPSI